MNEYQKLAARTINTKLTRYEQAMHALHGLTAEVGEIHDIYQKVYQGHDMDRKHLKSEVGDLLWFIAEYCTANEWDLADVMADNIEKLKKRYPEGFDADHSLHRSERDI